MGYNDNGTPMTQDHPKPVYLAAFTANNSPGDTWGPRRKAHQSGAYAHLRKKIANNNISLPEYNSNRSPVPMNETDTITGVKSTTYSPRSTGNDHDEEEEHIVRF